MRKTMFCTLLVFILICSVISFRAQAQASIRFIIEEIDVSLFPKIETYLSVTDPQGHPIRGVSEENFSVTEDGEVVDDFSITPVQNVELPISFVLAIDTSGSMPVGQAVSAAKGFVNSLSPQDQVAVVSFADQVTVSQPLTTEKAQVIQTLNNLSAGGDTALYDAIWQAADLLKDVSTRKVVIPITDGVDSQISEHSLEQVISDASQWGVPIYPLGFGSVDTVELNDIADATGGFAQIQPDASELKGMFKTISTILREQYLLRFTSNLPADGNQHELSIEFDDESGSAEDKASFVAQPGVVSVSLPDFSEGETVGGTVLFAPEISSPAPISRLDITDRKSVV